MEQVVVDVIHLQLAQRAFVHLLRLLEAPETFILVGELRGDVVGLARVAAEGQTGGRLVLPATVDGRSVEVVDAVGQCVIDQLVHLFLLARQAHHAETQQRDLLPAAVLRAVGHGRRTLLGRGGLRFAVPPAFGKDGGSSGGERVDAGDAQPHPSEELASVHVVCLLMVHFHVLSFTFRHFPTEKV